MHESFGTFRGDDVKEHLSQEELKAFLDGELPSKRKRDLLIHLLRGCEHCQTLAGWCFNPPPWSAQDEALYEETYKESIKEVLRAEQRRKNQETKMRAAALLVRGKGVAEILGEGDMPLRGLGLYEALLERSWAVRHDNPDEMIELARTAVQVAHDLNPAEYGTENIFDYQAQAWAEYGNALRTKDDLWEAQRAFGKAVKLLNQGSGNLLLKARLHDLHASLLGTQRKFALAFDALDLVYELYKDAGDSHLAGRALIIKAVYLHRSGRSEEAMELNIRGLQQIEEEREPGISAWALHNELLFLNACGRHKEARAHLFQNRSRLANSGRVNKLKVTWAEARISLSLDDLGKAESGFLHVWEGFTKETCQQFAAALSGVELALVWMRQGRADKAEAIVLEAFEIFCTLSIHREVLGAVQLLRDAFSVKKASVPLIERVVSFLQEWEINPDARFLPSNE